MHSKSDNQGSNRQASISWLIKWILTDTESLSVRILLILGALSSLVSLFYRTVEFTCQLSFVQNVLLVFFIASLAIEKIHCDLAGQRLKIGAITGFLSGGFVAAVGSIVDSIHYYWLGGRETAFMAFGNPISPITPTILYYQVVSWAVIWVMLTVLSTMVGMLASLTTTIKKRYLRQ